MTLSPEQELVAAVRAGDAAAWRELIEQFEGRLQAFAFSRLGDRSLAEDVVQETLLGFLTSLPHYDAQRTRLESFLFQIAAYKITDHLRKLGRRPALSTLGDSSLAGGGRAASSLFRSREQTDLQQAQLLGQLRTILADWKSSQQWERLKVCELLFVRGWRNQQVAETLQISEQQVANHKHAFTSRLKQTSPPPASN